MFWEILPWFISATTATSMWLAGNKSPHAWTLSLCNQVLWVTLMFHSRLWGLLPLGALLTVIYTRNLLRWRREREENLCRVRLSTNS